MPAVVVSLKNEDYFAIMKTAERSKKTVRQWLEERIPSLVEKGK